jgi:hypothetical protein
MGTPARVGTAVSCLEEQVPIHRRLGRASRAELMILAPGTAVAVDAKYTEPAYETVKRRLRGPPFSFSGPRFKEVGSAMGRRVNAG